MNHQKATAKLLNLSQVTKRVFWAIPIREAWSPSQVFAELKRQNKPVQDLRHVTHCLKELADTGLVKEGPRGIFSRDHVDAEPRIEPAAVKSKSENKPTVVSTKIENKKTLRMPMSNDSTQKTEPVPIMPWQKRAEKIAQTLRTLADDVEMLALEALEACDKDKAELEQLRQLKTLLKGLN